MVSFSLKAALPSTLNFSANLNKSSTSEATEEGRVGGGRVEAGGAIVEDAEAELVDGSSGEEAVSGEVGVEQDSKVEEEANDDEVVESASTEEAPVASTSFPDGQSSPVLESQTSRAVC